jgi:proteasome lid subunit RPN8/RPN11
MSGGGFRYLIPENLFDELVSHVKKSKLKLVSGWIFADRKENFGIITGYMVDSENSDAHVRPKSWMRMKKSKIFTMRKLKMEKGCDIVWQFHSHPDGVEDLDEVDLKILNYLSTGVMIIITSTNILGWFFDKRETKKPTIDKMVFEIISE